MPTRRLTAALTALAAFALTTVPAGAAATGTDAGTNRALAQVRQATHQYHDVEAAIEAGYEPTDHCVPGMGYHYVNPTMVDGALDPEQPEVVIYAPGDEGLELVAVEYLSTDPGSALFGEHLHYTPPIDLHALHAWVWRGNPDGVFAHHNESVHCPSH